MQILLVYLYLVEKKINPAKIINIIMEYRNVLLISEDYIKSESNLDNNVSGKYLQSAIKLAQDIELQSLIGTKLLEKIQKLIID